MRVGLATGSSAARPNQVIIPPAEVKARHIPATIEIVNRPAEITADWRRIWDELGLKRPSALLAERKQEAVQYFTEELGVNVSQGNEAADLRRKNSPNLFGRHAYEDYMRRSRAEVTIDVAPKSRIPFDVRVHPPEINVQTGPIANVKTG